VTDVADPSQVQRLADEAVREFGRIDTWVNNAAVALYATFEDSTLEEIEQVLRVNLLGAMYGAKAALPEMKRRGGGTIINVGSIESERALPYHTAYAASKHGLKGFTDTLRLELQYEGVPVHVTSVQPASTNTPFFDHARSRLGVKPAPIPPVYDPGLVAEAIMNAAQRPRRDIYVGSASKTLSVLERISPALVDRMLLTRGMGFQGQQRDERADERDNLFEPIQEPGSARGPFGEGAMASCPYTRYVEQRPAVKPVLLALAVGAWFLAKRARQ
jgi:short-subunit dehydrogenase